MPLTLLALAGMYAGLRLQKRVSADTYKRLLRYVLFLLAAVLLWQGGSWFLR